LLHLLQEIDSGILVDDHINNNSNSAIPNYSYIHSHDKGVQDAINVLLLQKGLNLNTATWSQLQEVLQTYYQIKIALIKNIIRITFLVHML
ncbi:hypothetical protein ACYATM_01615, partial [Lactobacillaceae bacterium Scapto_B20]